MHLRDAAMGTELRRRGFELRAPLFASAALRGAPELVIEIHRDHLRAGAQFLTTNSFMLGAPGSEAADAIALAHVSVELARRAIELEAPHEGARPRIVGGLGPHLELSEAAIAALAGALLDAGAERLLFETVSEPAFARRALGATQALATARGVERWLSCFWPAGRWREGGDPLALADGSTPAPDLLAVNCVALSELDASLAALDRVAAAWGVARTGLWPNLSEMREGEFEAVAHSDADFAAALLEAARAYPRLAMLGACCGSTPSTLRALAQRLGAKLS